jgi:methylmalonyl-CoA mutase cobalamin-binding domain/chain
MKTDSGIEIKELYTAGNSVEADHSLPGEFPFTRGVQASMYRGKMWTMRQYAGFSTAEESNKRYHYLLSQGVSGLSVAFDLPTQIGYDSDHELADGEVGKVGVAIDRRSIYIYDHKCIWFYFVGILCSAGKKARSRYKKDFGNHTKRHFKRIRSKRYVYLSTKTIYAHHHRYF